MMSLFKFLEWVEKIDDLKQCTKEYLVALKQFCEAEIKDKTEKLELDSREIFKQIYQIDIEQSKKYIMIIKILLKKQENTTEELSKMLNKIPSI